jgi:hypothetical protein
MKTFFVIVLVGSSFRHSGTDEIAVIEDSVFNQ